MNRNKKYESIYKYPEEFGEQLKMFFGADAVIQS
jgi:hypothetical protein